MRDPHKNRQMMAAHELAVARGYQADSPDYFSSIEKTLDLASPKNGAASHTEETDPLSDPSAVEVSGGRQASPPAAPVSRTAVGNNGSRPNVVRLTAAEVEIAGEIGMTPEEYARNKMQLMKEGKLS